MVASCGGVIIIRLSPEALNTWSGLHSRQTSVQRGIFVRSTPSITKISDVGDEPSVVRSIFVSAAMAAADKLNRSPPSNTRRLRHFGRRLPILLDQQRATPQSNHPTREGNAQYYRGMRMRDSYALHWSCQHCQSPPSESQQAYRWRQCTLQLFYGRNHVSNQNIHLSTRSMSASRVPK